MSKTKAIYHFKWSSGAQPATDAMFKSNGIIERGCNTERDD